MHLTYVRLSVGVFPLIKPIVSASICREAFKEVYHTVNKFSRESLDILGASKYGYPE